MILGFPKKDIKDCKRITQTICKKLKDNKLPTYRQDMSNYTRVLKYEWEKLILKVYMYKVRSLERSRAETDTRLCLN